MGKEGSASLKSSPPTGGSEKAMSLIVGSILITLIAGEEGIVDSVAVVMNCNVFDMPSEVGSMDEVVSSDVDGMDGFIDPSGFHDCKDRFSHC